MACVSRKLQLYYQIQKRDADGLSRPHVSSNSDKTVNCSSVMALSTSSGLRSVDSIFIFCLSEPASVSHCDVETVVPDDVVQAQSLCSKDWVKAQQDDPNISYFVYITAVASWFSSDFPG